MHRHNTNYLLFVVCLLSLIAQINAQCPWTDTALLKWNTTVTGWTVPTAGADVIIDNKRVLLNISPPRLNSITIRNNGSLVWDNVDGIQLYTKYIKISTGGRLDIGSESCLFTKKTTIVLYGKESEVPVDSECGKKFLCVAAGGTIELHGRDPSPSWTQLTNSVDPFLYTSGSTVRGMNVATFNTAGQFVSAGGYDVSFNATQRAALTTYINSLPAGQILAVAIRDEGSLIDDALRAALDTVGAVRHRTLTYRGSYALIGVKGSAPGTAVEVMKNTTTGGASVSKTFTVAASGNDWTLAVTSQGMNDGNTATIKGTWISHVLSFKQNVSWPVGNRVVLASTDFGPFSTEEANIIACSNCKGNQIKVQGPLKYRHFGQIERGVDMRGEVALLNRSIVITSETQASCYQTSPSYLCGVIPYDSFGGHFRVLKNFANVHVENVEFSRMGQLQAVGNYPVHFHMVGDADQVGGYAKPAYIKKCSVHHSFSRCYTIHGSHGVTLKDNLGYDSVGHCFFLEDGIESRNTIDGNLGLVTRAGPLLPTDRDNFMCRNITPTDFNGMPTDYGTCNAISTFWITNPNNVVINNVAGGSVHTGFWYILPDRPTGLSTQNGIDQKAYPTRTPLGKFDNNRAHSNLQKGLFFDDGIKTTPASASAPQEILSKVGSRYKPRVNPTNTTSARAPAVFTRYTAYKNREGIWVRGGDFRFYDAWFSDNLIGVTLASEGTMPNDPGSSQTLARGVFIGESSNIGTPNAPNTNWMNGRANLDPYFPIRGVSVYDGPVSFTNVTFYGYFNTPTRNCSGIGWLLNNHWQLSPNNNISGASFPDNSSRLLLVRTYNYNTEADGDNNIVVKDLDGSLTGVVGGNVMRHFDFFKTKNCVTRNDWPFGGQVCNSTQKIVQMFINNRNYTYTNFNGTKGGALMVRDEKPSSPHPLVGISNNNNPTIQVQPLLINQKSYTLHFGYPTPNNLRLTLVSGELGYNVRVGVCFPRSSALNFTVLVFNGTATTVATQVATLAAVDSDVNGRSFYFDSSAGLLFVKTVTALKREGDYYCGTGQPCPYVNIEARGSAMGTNSGDCRATAYPKYTRVEP